MSVFDRELIIDGEAVRSPEQQVWQNMKDIKALKLKIKDWYSCSTELDTTDVSVARTSTNVPDSVSEGFLLDTGGNLFNITGGDEDNLLLYYYATIKGEQGEQGPSGAELEIDDSGTSATKVWSSQKVSTELANAGKKYYKHIIYFQGTNDNVNMCGLIIDCDKSTQFTFSELLTFLRNHNCERSSNSVDYSKVYPGFGRCYIGGSFYTLDGFSRYDEYISLVYNGNVNNQTEGSWNPKKYLIIPYELS